ncbi:MAG: sensor histidine kinase [Marinilabiliales bacterium]|nr:MAG: sensor histidine kinase [Marinilabiliales bacterium]
MGRFSSINVRGRDQPVKVRVGSDSKPGITSEVIEKWQSLIDTAAKITGVPSGLIMKLNPETIEVFMKSNTEGNPYKAGDEERLDLGLYCETVIGTGKMLLLPDARKSSVWKDNNPDIGLNMIAYLGFPINWPDGEVFGTVCLLDSKENRFSDDYISLLRQVKQHIETDLKLLVSAGEMKKAYEELEKLSDIKTRFLSLISHDIRGGIGTIEELLKLTVERMDGYDEKKLRKILVSLSETAGSVYLTLENLLNWSKNDLLFLDPDKKVFSLVRIIDDLLVYFRQAIIIKNIEVAKDFPSGDAVVFADENMVTTSLRNILSNAVKYNHPNGKVIIKLLNAGDKVLISIEDTGIGMDEAAVERLFSYDPGKVSEGTYGESSSGLGLFLTRDFIEKNNGTIRVHSRKGEGTTFEISLPAG